MRYDEAMQWWVHTSDEEKLYGLSRTSSSQMPPSMVKAMHGLGAEADRLRERLASATHLLEQARKLHPHDALGQLILQWMTNPPKEPHHAG